jgi:anti-sigma B factor antagonist
MILDLDGPLVGGSDSAGLLKDKVRSVVQQGSVQLVVNFAKVAVIDSAGLGEMVSCYTVVSRANGRLALANLTKRNQDLLTITRLVTLFDTYSSEAEAIASFGRPAV